MLARFVTIMTRKDRGRWARQENGKFPSTIPRDDPSSSEDRAEKCRKWLISRWRAWFGSRERLSYRYQSRSSIRQLGKSNREGTKEQFQVGEEKRERERAFAFKGMPRPSTPFLLSRWTFLIRARLNGLIQSNKYWWLKSALAGDQFSSVLIFAGFERNTKPPGFAFFALWL